MTDIERLDARIRELSANVDTLARTVDLLQQHRDQYEQSIIDAFKLRDETAVLINQRLAHHWQCLFKLAEATAGVEAMNPSLSDVIDSGDADLITRVLGYTEIEGPVQ